MKTNKKKLSKRSSMWKWGHHSFWSTCWRETFQSGQCFVLACWASNTTAVIPEGQGTFIPKAQETVVFCPHKCLWPAPWQVPELPPKHCAFSCRWPHPWKHKCKTKKNTHLVFKPRSLAHLQISGAPPFLAWKMSKTFVKPACDFRETSWQKAATMARAWSPPKERTWDTALLG